MAKEKSIPVVKCSTCNTVGIPPQYVCGKCGDTHFIEAEISGKTRIYTYTTMRVAPEAFQAQAPYDIAIVDLPHDLRVTARIEKKEDEKIYIGCEVSFERMEENLYWFKIDS